MKFSLKRISLIFAGLIIIFVPMVLLGKGGVYTSTKHGNTTTGVYRIQTEPRGACSQCHYEHASYDGSPTGGPYDYMLFAANTNSLCYTCHNTASALNIYQGSTIYNQSSHAMSSFAVWPGPNPSARQTSDWGKCINCHSPHGQRDATGLLPNMALAREDNLCLTCHDGMPSNKNIYAELLKLYKHPISSVTGRHSSSEGGSPGNFASPMNRHSECEDCHNPHYAKADSILPTAPNASNHILGMGRIQVTNGPAGSIPTYTYRGPSDTTFAYEYEVCFKCHSSWTTQPAGQTNLALVLNPNNPSYHPVEAQGKNRNIDPNAFVNNWTWDKLTYCSDCHGSDNTAVRGPHGSANAHILKKPYTASSSQQTMSSTELCFDCHRYDTYANNNASSAVKGYSRFNPPGINQGHTYHVGSRRYPCYACHQTHGNVTRPALIATGRSPGLNSYTQTPNGGSCSPTCHGGESYTINYPR